MSAPRWPFLVPGLLALMAPASSARGKEVEVNVNVDLSDAGRKLTLPTPEHPVYYLPWVGGYRQEGEMIAGQKEPPRPAVLHELAVMLAQQGYLVVGPKTPPPSLLLVFFWGSLNPLIDGISDPDDGPKAFLNQKQMVALVGGQAMNNLDLFSAREEVMQGAEDNRYFVVITAYDFAAIQQKRKVLLWRTKMSTPSTRVDLGEVLPALLATGGPWFGRETIRPVWVTQTLKSRGNVNLGELKVEEYLKPAAAAGQKPRPP